MKFRNRGVLDTGQVSDRRGMGGGLGGIGLPRGAAIGGGGGIVGVIVVVVLLLANGLGGGGSSTSSNSFDGAGELSTNCRTGADANQRTDCLVTAVVNSVFQPPTSKFQTTCCFRVTAYTRGATSGRSAQRGRAQFRLVRVLHFTKMTIQ